MKMKSIRKRFLRFRKKYKKNAELYNSLAVFVLLFLVIGGAWFGSILLQERNNHKEQINRYRAEGKKIETIDDILSAVREHIILDFSDRPLIVRIDDAQTLREQQDFFANSKNGDIVIVYHERAILYRPSRDILVNVGPVNFAETEQNEKQEIGISIDIRNGSEVAGLAGSMGEILKTKNYEIYKVSDANRNDYEEDVLVNMSGKNISYLEDDLGIKSVDVLPVGEARSKADVVMILGNK